MFKTSSLDLKSAYSYCRAINKSHYENFPVASFLLPKKIRPAVDAIYAFSRVADDFADEAEFDGRRLELLDEWERSLDDKEPQNAIFVALQDARRRHELPKKLFVDLLSAFKQDVVKTRYQNFAQVLDYCTRSANPVGRLLLHLFKENSEENLKYSDAICTALQLANFWQDVFIDLKKDRIYLPQDEMERFGIKESELRVVLDNHFLKSLSRLLFFQIQRTREIFLQGAPLGLNLKGRLGAEIRLTWLTGNLILDKIEANDFDVAQHRPELKKTDFIKLLPKAFFKNIYKNKVKNYEMTKKC